MAIPVGDNRAPHAVLHDRLVGAKDAVDFYRRRLGYRLLGYQRRRGGMKIELTIQELLEIIDMIKYGENNEGDDFYLMQDFLDGKDDPKSKKQ